MPDGFCDLHPISRRRRTDADGKGVEPGAQGVFGAMAGIFVPLAGIWHRITKK